VVGKNHEKERVLLKFSTTRGRWSSMCYKEKTSQWLCGRFQKDTIRERKKENEYCTSLRHNLTRVPYLSYLKQQKEENHLF